MELTIKDMNMIKLETNYDKLKVTSLILESKLSIFEKAQLVLLDMFNLDWNEPNEDNSAENILKDIVKFDFGNDIDAYLDAVTSLKWDFYIWFMESNDPRYLKKFRKAVKKAISALEKYDEETKSSKKYQEFYDNLFIKIKEKYLRKNYKNLQ